MRCFRGWPSASITQRAFRRRAADAFDRPRLMTSPSIILLDEATEG
jgi:hypothetical protein